MAIELGLPSLLNVLVLFDVLLLLLLLLLLRGLGIFPALLLGLARPVICEGGRLSPSLELLFAVLDSVGDVGLDGDEGCMLARTFFDDESVGELIEVFVVPALLNGLKFDDVDDDLLIDKDEDGLGSTSSAEQPPLIDL